MLPADGDALDESEDDHSGEDARTIEERIRENHSRGQGAPTDPRAAAYYPTMALVRAMLRVEIKNDLRLPVILAELERVELKIFDAATDCETLNEQNEAVGRASTGPLYLRHPTPRRRAQTGPSGAELLVSYERILPALQAWFGRIGDRDTNLLAEILREKFPCLSKNQSLDAAYSGPSQAAEIIIGVTHNLSPGTIHIRVSEARKVRRY